MTAPRWLPVVLAPVVSASAACTAAQVQDYFHRFDRSVSGAVTKASLSLGILPERGRLTATHAVRVRSGPGIDHDVIGGLAAGEQATVLAERDGWVRIEYGRDQGWVAARYASVERPGGEAPAQVAAPDVPEQDGASATARGGADTGRTSARSGAAAEPATRARDPEPSASQPAGDLAMPVGARGGAPAFGPDGEVPAGEVEVAGIVFSWGEPRRLAVRRYADHAARIDPNGAVWLKAATVEDGVMVPAEWFDLRFCRMRLCGIHHVVNAVGDERPRAGEQAAAMLEKRHGPPAADFWTDTGYGRVRVRTWRTPDSRIRLTHQEEQTYAAIDYEPPRDAPPQRGLRGRFARDTSDALHEVREVDGSADADLPPR